jgi:hypothetical protein
VPLRAGAGVAAAVRGRSDWRSWAAVAKEQRGSGGRTSARLTTDGSDHRLASHLHGVEELEL